MSQGALKIGSPKQVVPRFRKDAISSRDGIFTSTTSLGLPENKGFFTLSPALPHKWGG
jgi:hypothetical protein